MQRSHAQLETALAPRDAFTRRHLQARCAKTSRSQGTLTSSWTCRIRSSWKNNWPTVRRQAPRKNWWRYPVRQKQDVTRRTGRAQHRQHTVDAAEPFPCGWRSCGCTSATQESERQTLTSGITNTYLRKVLPELDLPKGYEDHHNTFMGSASETPFVREHRRECLVEPWRLMLKLQGQCAQLQNQINRDELQVLTIAIDANTREVWQAHGKRIVLLPAYLSAGGKDTPNEGPTTLSGVTFIEEQVSGMTLLYLPDSPDGQCLRRYDNLQSARRALFNLCLRSEMVGYLAGRALSGNEQAHASRISQAVLKHFDAMIGVGLAWPTTTSLAEHLLNAQMGRLIQAHRDTSRSRSALYLERYALSGTKAFNYIKMAMGLVPFVGSAVALYDAWSSANNAVAVLLRGEVGEGLAEIEAVLLSLIDAAMDLASGAAPGTRSATAARALTRARQLQTLGKGAVALRPTSARQARHIAQRFAGYEYEQPISLAGLQPLEHGVYRNVYRHADGDFIIRQGRIFQVELSKDSRGLRLSGTRKKTYRQPIALDEAGQWDTWLGVYGSTFEGGGLGGGGVLGHLADALDPIWPQAIRDRLPDWWRDRGIRRHQQLTEKADSLAQQLNERIPRSNDAINTYIDSPLEQRQALLPSIEAICLADIELGARQYQTLADLLPLTHGNKRRTVLDMQSSAAHVLADRFKQRVFYLNHRMSPVMDELDALIVQLDNLPGEAVRQRLATLEQIRKTRATMVRDLEQLDVLMADLKNWYARITNKTSKATLTPEVTELTARFSEANLLYLKTSHLLEIVNRLDGIKDVSWFYLQEHSRSLRAKVDLALYTQYTLSTGSGIQGRNQVLQNGLELYTRFLREMKVWTSSYPQHFNMDAVEQLLAGIEKMADRARKGIDLPAPPATPGQVRKKVFTTEDGLVLFGVEEWVEATQSHRYRLTGKGNVEEIWEQGSNGRFRLLNAPAAQSIPAPTDLAMLVADARNRLDLQPAYQARVQSYAEQDMLPVDLEHMMVSEADELSRRALRIEQLDARNPIIETLRDKAGELMTLGRTLRTRQSLSSKKPTDGMLDDLVRQQVVEIRKPDFLKNLGKRKDGRVDYLQEYEIWNLSAEPATLQWYAHFHYASARPVFRQFEKAHLKLTEHRFLTHADDANLPYADIGKRSVALEHFEHL